MSVDTPAKIVVIGSGPIGLEAALYGRYLGYEVEIVEAGDVCENVLQWGHVQMFSPFAMNCSPLGMAALKAQDPAYQPPPLDALLTGRQWAEQYLIPLAQSDLLSDHIRTQTEAIGIRRTRYLKHELAGDPRRGHDTFEVHCLDFNPDQGESTGVTPREFSITAKIVLDCSGTFGNPVDCLPSGMEAIIAGSEVPRVTFEIPDLSGEGRSEFADRRTLVLGSGYSAATTVTALAELAREAPATRIVWLTRATVDESQAGPLMRIANDRLPQRDALAEQANQLAVEEGSPVEWLAGGRLVALSETSDGQLLARYRRFPPQVVEPAPGDEEAWTDDTQSEAFEEHEIVIDRVVANCGSRPDIELFRELQVHLCYASEGPMKLAAALQASAGSAIDCLEMPSCEADSLVTSEPHFYLLGAKSYGRNSHFLFATGLQQIREAFTVIAGRQSLDLYASVKNLA